MVLALVEVARCRTLRLRQTLKEQKNAMHKCWKCGSEYEAPLWQWLLTLLVGAVLGIGAFGIAVIIEVQK